MKLQPASCPGASRLSIGVPALAAVVLLALASAGAQAAIYSEAVVFASDPFIEEPVIRLSTDESGEVLSASMTAKVGYFRYATGEYVQTGSVSGETYAATFYGVNRVGSASGLGYVAAPENDRGNSIPGYTGASAASSWTDLWTIVGGTPGSTVSGVVKGHIDFGLALTGPVEVGPGTSGLQASYVFQANDGSVIFDDMDFLSTSGGPLKTIDWEVNFTARSGESFFAESVFVAATNQCGISDPVSTFCAYAFSATRSSIMDLVTLPEGYSLTSQSGEIVTHGGGFTYQASLDEVAPPVPEPETFFMLAVGLGLVAGASSAGRSRGNHVN